jgi:hypothetical protein
LTGLFDGLQSCNFERYVYRRGALCVQIKFFRSWLKTKLRNFNPVMTDRQRRQAEFAVFRRPTQPRFATRRFHEAQRGSGNAYALGRVHEAVNLRCYGSILCPKEAAGQEKQRSEKTQP